MTNLGDADYFLGSDIEAYFNNKKLEAYPVDGVTYDSIPPGRTFENAKTGFAVEALGEVELEVKPVISFDASEKAIIKVALQ